MIEHSRRDGAGSIVALENELLVRDFIDLLNDGAVGELRGFLHQTSSTGRRRRQRFADATSGSSIP